MNNSYLVKHKILASVGFDPTAPVTPYGDFTFAQLPGKPVPKGFVPQVTLGADQTIRFEYKPFPKEETEAVVDTTRRKRRRDRDDASSSVTHKTRAIETNGAGRANVTLQTGREKPEVAQARLLASMKFIVNQLMFGGSAMKDVEKAKISNIVSTLGKLGAGSNNLALVQISSSGKDASFKPNVRELLTSLKHKIVLKVITGKPIPKIEDLRQLSTALGNISTILGLAGAKKVNKADVALIADITAMIESIPENGTFPREKSTLNHRHIHFARAFPIYLATVKGMIDSFRPNQPLSREQQTFLAELETALFDSALRGVDSAFGLASYAPGVLKQTKHFPDIPASMFRLGLVARQLKQSYIPESARKPNYSSQKPGHLSKVFGDMGLENSGTVSHGVYTMQGKLKKAIMTLLSRATVGSLSKTEMSDVFHIFSEVFGQVKRNDVYQIEALTAETLDIVYQLATYSRLQLIQYMEAFEASLTETISGNEALSKDKRLPYEWATYQRLFQLLREGNDSELLRYREQNGYALVGSHFFHAVIKPSGRGLGFKSPMEDVADMAAFKQELKVWYEKHDQPKAGAPRLDYSSRQPIAAYLGLEAPY